MTISNLVSKANGLDIDGEFKLANEIDDFITKIAKKKAVVYHYAGGEAQADSIQSNGLLAPSQLVGTEFFDDIKNNYTDRIKKCYKGKITDDVILDYLDYQRAPSLDEFHAGRNMIFGLFSEIYKGVSKSHDRFSSLPLFSIDVAKLYAENKKDIAFIIEEIPFLPIDDNFQEVDMSVIESMSGKDMLQFYDEANAEGLLFATVPHLAIWMRTGTILPKYLKRIR